MSMAVAYWCVAIAAFLPYVWTTVAKQSGERYDNRDPRGWIARQAEPKVHRANAAQLNAFEAFPAFAAGVLMAQFAGAPAAEVAWVSIVFVIARVLHGVVYIAGMKHSLRSLVWFVGFACAMWLIGSAAWHIGGVAAQ